MAVFGREMHDEIVVEGIPDDIVERLERRVREERWLGTDQATWKYRVHPRDGKTEGPREHAYREGAPRDTVIRVEVTSSAASAVLEDVELDFSDPTRVVYRAQLTRPRKLAFIIGGVFFSIFSVFAFIAGSQHLGLSAVLGGFAAALGLFMAFVGVSDAKHKTKTLLEKILREEVAAARNEARLVGLGASTSSAGATALAVLSVLGARGVSVSSEERAHVLTTTDAPTLGDWLKKAATATRASDVFARAGSHPVRVAVEDSESNPIEDGVSARVRRGSD